MPPSNKAATLTIANNKVPNARYRARRPRREKSLLPPVPFLSGALSGPRRSLLINDHLADSFAFRRRWRRFKSAPSRPAPEIASSSGELCGG
jgi:hypothetical protein